MSLGTLTFERFNGTEQFSVSKADIFLFPGDPSAQVSFDFETHKTPLKALPDTETLHAHPNGEFNLEVPCDDVGELVGHTFSIPVGENDGEWLARIYYVEHDTAKNCNIRVLEREGDHFHVVVEGHCTDLNFYDGSKPDTHFVLDAWFALRR